MIQLLAAAAIPDVQLPDSVHIAEFNRNELPGLQNIGSLTVDQLLRLDSGSEPFVAISGNSDPESLSDQLRLLCEASPEVAVVVPSERSVPRSLLDGFPESLRILLQRFTDQDLISIPRPVLQTADRRQTVWSLILQSGGAIASEVLPASAARFPELGPGHPGVSPSVLKRRLEASPDISGLDAFSMACLQSGVLLLWDHLEASHTISQNLEGEGSPRTADYWHGIMHRREPDLGNAGYWFRSLGYHPAFDSLRSKLADWMVEMQRPAEEIELVRRSLLNESKWNPFSVIDMDRLALNRPNGLEDRTLRVVMYLEMLNLLRFSLD